MFVILFATVTFGALGAGLRQLPQEGAASEGKGAGVGRLDVHQLRLGGQLR